MTIPFRNVGGKFTTPRTILEGGTAEYLQKIVEPDDFLAGVFEHASDRSACPWGRVSDGRAGWPIKFENYDEQAALKFAKENQRPWFKTHVADNRSLQKGLGRFGFSTSYHLCYLFAYVRTGSGTVRLRMICEAFADFFKDLNPETGRDQGVNIGLAAEEWDALEIRQPSILEPGVEQDEEGWFKGGIMFPVELNRFYRDRP